MSKRGWPVSLVVLFAGVLVGCGDDAKSSRDGGVNGGGADRTAGPAPPAGGTLTDDTGKSSMSIPRVPNWEQYVAEHKTQNGGEEPPEPRTRKEIYEEEIRLPRLYLTHQTLTRVIAPGNLRVHKHAETGEMCSPASGCYNPECPGRGEDGEPYAFITAHPQLGVVCPACIDVRDLAGETDADRARYARWVHPHELPETLARLRELTEDRRRRIAWERANR